MKQGLREEITVLRNEDKQNELIMIIGTNKDVAKDSDPAKF